jgi:hypothetical protein
MKTSSFESASSSGGSGGGGGGGGGEGSGSFNLRNLSKLILPPLGVPAGGHAQSGHAGPNDRRVISPLDSRYRSVRVTHHLSLFAHASPWRHGSQLA